MMELWKNGRQFVFKSHYSSIPVFHYSCISMSESIVVLVTCASEQEALKIAHSLVEERLAACVNLVSPIRSIYRWEGKICDEREWLLVVKTQRQKFDDLEKKVKSLHSYSVPEIIGLAIVEGSSSYVNWLAEMTK